MVLVPAPASPGDAAGLSADASADAAASDGAQAHLPADAAGAAGAAGTSGHAGRLSATDRRESLIETARELVAEGGVEAVTMDAVANRAGVSRTLLYKHFANLDDLLSALLVRSAMEMDAQIATRVFAASGPEAKYRAIAEATLDVVDGNPVFAAFSRGEFDHLVRADVDGFWSAREKRNRAAYGRLLATVMGLDQRDADLAVMCSRGALQEMLIQRMAAPEIERERVVEVFVRSSLGTIAFLMDRSLTVTAGPVD